jgi:signal transduction histidine kinase
MTLRDDRPPAESEDPAVQPVSSGRALRDNRPPAESEEGAVRPVSSGQATERQPRSTRPLNAAWVGGVCAGLADHLGWSVLLLRVVAVVLAAIGLVGVAIYFALWLVMPPSAEQRSAPGLEANTRKGLRPRGSVNLTPVDLGMASALGLLGVGLLWMLQASVFALPAWVLIAGLLAAAGLGLIWWQADHLSTRELRRGSGWRRLLAPLMAHWTTLVTIGVGLVALTAAVAIVVVAQTALGEVARTLLVLGLAVGGLLLAVLPWILSVRQALAQARDDALVADARADMAAHLHDSVLQTLALIQRRAGDPKAVTALARRQERELRQWLYGESLGSATLSEALSAEIIDVEDRHGVDVELVSVGDCELTPEVTAVVKAAREAMVNAAKHSGAERIDVYAEADPDLLSVYVRDRGTGFDLADVDDDRMGVRGSIIERVKRVGGRAIIRTAPGEGTEVRLELPR